MNFVNVNILGMGLGLVAGNLVAGPTSFNDGYNAVTLTSSTCTVESSSALPVSPQSPTQGEGTVSWLSLIPSLYTIQDVAKLLLGVGWWVIAVFLVQGVLKFLGCSCYCMTKLTNKHVG